MPTFSYRGRDRSGKIVNGELQAETAAGVAEQLLTAEITPVDIQAGVTFVERRKGFGLGRLFSPKLSTEELMLFCRQMSALAKAGIPIVRALRSLAESSRNPIMRRVLLDVIETLGGGRDLAGAFARHSDLFPALFINVIRVGESSGRLEEAFQRLFQYLSFEKYTNDRIQAALRYPAIVLVAVTVAVGVIMVSVVPQFALIFKSFGSELPVPTKIIIAVSNFMAAYWYFMLGAFVAAYFGLQQWIKTEGGRYFWDRLKLNIPVIGSIVQRGTLARFARAFTMAFRSGVPLLEALTLISRAVNNEFVGRRIRQMRDSVERGEMLSRAAGTTLLFTPLVLQMIAVGEETGRLDDMLDEVADFYERDVQADVDNLGALLEPILIGMVGLVVLMLALGVFLPMWDLAGAAMSRG